jgi:hypothetical protein
MCSYCPYLLTMRHHMRVVASFISTLLAFYFLLYWGDGEHTQYDSKVGKTIGGVINELYSPKGVNLTAFVPWINAINSNLYTARESNNKYYMDSSRNVYFSMSDTKYSGRFDEILNQSIPLGFPTAIPAMIAFDEATKEYFEIKHDVPTYLMDDASIPIGKRVMRAKFHGTLALLIAGFNVYFGEMDIYWRSPPDASFFNSDDVEFVVSQHKHGPEINIGFYFARPTPHMIETMERLVSFLEMPGRTTTNRKITFDQKLFDLAVRGPSPTQQLTGGKHSNILNITEKEFLKPPHQPYLNWTYLPYQVLEHWPIHGMNAEYLAGVHVWSGMGPPEKQIDWALRCFAGRTYKEANSSCM